MKTFIQLDPGWGLCWTEHLQDSYIDALIGVEREQQLDSSNDFARRFIACEHASPGTVGPEPRSVLHQSVHHGQVRLHHDGVGTGPSHHQTEVDAETTIGT